MPTVYVDSPGPYLRYGLEHFMKRNGLSLTSSPRSADIYIAQSSPGDCNARVQIILGSGDKEGLGYLHLLGETIPLFRQPMDTPGTGTFASAVFEDREYPCITIEGRRIVCGFDVFSEIGRILAGHYDPYFLKKDPVGTMLRALPVVDILEDSLVCAIRRASPQRSLIQPFRWPQGHQFALVVTHDVDRVSKTYQYLPSILQSLKKADISGLAYHLKNLLLKHGKSDPYWTFDFLNRLEESQGIKSTYYFLNETG